jgi:hypothetical protein
MDTIMEEVCPAGMSVQDKEAYREKMFRTQYRAVESEVVGLAVKW